MPHRTDRTSRGVRRTPGIAPIPHRPSLGAETKSMKRGRGRPDAGTTKQALRPASLTGSPEELAEKTLPEEYGE